MIFILLSRRSSVPNHGMHKAFGKTINPDPHMFASFGALSWMTPVVWQTQNEFRLS